MVGSAQVVGARDGEYVRFKSLGTRYVVSSEQTGGAFAVVEHDLDPRELGAPTHTHAHEDEISHVLSGRLGVQIADEALEAGPGDTVVKPRGVPHAFWNPGDEPVRFLEMITPAGFEGYFRELAPVLNAQGPPDFEALAAIRDRYVLDMDMDSMIPLIQAHGLNMPPM